eukprot:NODE_5150_length_977_cov_73.441452_g4940_i0.p1 GENE.NODE_5150_length_977_cov_73.441452_g4940_i0~~NODE_5150_length_977_cov_73.441452_g4940_i0.p1  ORF type:complete len:207 (-),score=64.18 NODE_5150_length_977_cov_73.441452_g4940_i0:357-914(-)
MFSSQMDEINACSARVESLAARQTELRVRRDEVSVRVRQIQRDLEIFRVELHMPTLLSEGPGAANHQEILADMVEKQTRFAALEKANDDTKTELTVLEDEFDKLSVELDAEKATIRRIYLAVENRMKELTQSAPPSMLESKNNNKAEKAEKKQKEAAKKPSKKKAPAKAKQSSSSKVASAKELKR